MNPLFASHLPLHVVGGGQYVLIPRAIGEKIIAKLGTYRVICRINTSFEIHCGLMSKKEEGFSIMMSHDTLKQVQEEVIESLYIELFPDDSKYGAPMPSEFQEVLDTDPEGLEVFDALPEGRRRGLIYWIYKAKRSETRINRSLKLIECLKMGITDPKEIIR